MTDGLRKSFHGELDAMRDTLVRMIAMVTEIVPRSTDAFLNNDLQAAQRLIEDDDAIDLLSTELDQQCMRLLALQQPLASDLREIVTALRLNSEVERSGDLVVNIAKATRRLYGTEYDPRLRGLITKMSIEAQRMFRLCGEAYAQHDAGLGVALDDIDDRLDELAYELIEIVFESHTRGDLDLQASMQLALIGRFYERIGDHAVNVGEQVHYIVTGVTPEHIGAARASARKLASGAAASAEAETPIDGVVAQESGDA